MKINTNKTIGFTGSRAGLANVQSMELATQLSEYSAPISPGVYEFGYFLHGDCVGADQMADEIADSLDFNIKMRPCNLSSQRAYSQNGIIIAEPAPPLDRNRLIVDDSDLMIACPKGFTEERRSGTWATIRYAIKTGKRIIIIYPDGSTQIKDGQDSILLSSR